MFDPVETLRSSSNWEAVFIHLSHPAFSTTSLSTFDHSEARCEGPKGFEGEGCEIAGDSSSAAAATAWCLAKWSSKKKSQALTPTQHFTLIFHMDTFCYAHLQLKIILPNAIF